jgi:ABC-type dipeptide/oligopeptide/nickel transport system permease subunit
MDILFAGLNSLKESLPEIFYTIISVAVIIYLMGKRIYKLENVSIINSLSISIVTCAFSLIIGLLSGFLLEFFSLREDSWTEIAANIIICLPYYILVVFLLERSLRATRKQGIVIALTAVIIPNLIEKLFIFLIS